MWPLLLLAAALGVACALPCEEARLRCAYRTGCGRALNNYMLLCNEVMTERMIECPTECEHALIALTSTEEGKALMTCRCEDEYCSQTKRQMEDVCRPQVLQGAANATSSCRLSQLICQADAQCATALGYYNDLCRAMYVRGRKCSKKCLNSIEILRKQEKAAPLTACQCDGEEDYDCPKMQNNLRRLCFKHPKGKNHGRGHVKHVEGERKHHHKKVHEVEKVSAASTASLGSTLALTTVFASMVLAT